MNSPRPGVPGAPCIRRARAATAYRIDPPAQVTAQRRVGHQVRTDRVFHQFAATIAEPPVAMVQIEIVIHLPIGRGSARPAASTRQVHAGGTSRDIAEERLSLEIELEREVVAEPAFVDADVGQKGQQGLDLGGKIDPLAYPGRVQRLDAEAIAGQQQLTFPFVPDGEGKHPAEVVHARRRPTRDRR